MSIKKNAAQFVWHELNTTEPKKARAFYGELFGWGFQEMDLGAMGKYTMFASQGTDLGGFAPLEGGGTRSHWLPYVSVDDVDAAAKRVPLLGGKIHVPPTDIPNVGRFAVLEDPTGATLAVFKGAA
jgi:predicted enzyme related to lactoylglutathione lyase